MSVYLCFAQNLTLSADSPCASCHEGTPAWLADLDYLNSFLCHRFGATSKDSYLQTCNFAGRRYVLNELDKHAHSLMERNVACLSKDAKD